MDDFWRFIETLGGGLVAVVIACLGVSVVALWKQNNGIQDKRIADQTSFWERLNDVMKSVETWVTSIKEQIAGVGTKLAEILHGLQEARSDLKEVLRLLRDQREDRK